MKDQSQSRRTGESVELSIRYAAFLVVSLSAGPPSSYAATPPPHFFQLCPFVLICCLSTPQRKHYAKRARDKADKPSAPSAPSACLPARKDKARDGFTWTTPGEETVIADERRKVSDKNLLALRGINSLDNL